jgi:hypothetical protein
MRLRRCVVEDSHLLNAVGKNMEGVAVAQHFPI